MSDQGDDFFEDNLDKLLGQFDEAVKAEYDRSDSLAKNREQFALEFDDKLQNIIIPTMEKYAARGTETAQLFCRTARSSATMTLSVKMSSIQVYPKKCHLVYRADDRRNRAVVIIEEDGNSPNRQVEETEVLLPRGIDERHVRDRIIKLIRLGQRINDIKV